MKKHMLLFCIILGSSGLFAQEKTSSDTIKHKLFLDLTNIIRPFQSIGLGLEYNLSNRNAVEIEAGYIYNSWFTKNVQGYYAKAAFKRYIKRKENSTLYHSRTYYSGLISYQFSQIKGVGAFNIEDKFTYIEEYNRNKNKFGVYALYGEEFDLEGGFYLDFNIGIGWQYANVAIESIAIDRFSTAILTNSGIEGILNNEPYSNFDAIISARIKKDLWW